MMPEIDEFSHLLGEMRADIKHLLKEVSFATVARNETANRIQNVEAIVVDIKDIKTWRDNKVDPMLNLHERWRQRGIGAWLLIVLIWTAAAAAVVALFNRLFGSGG